MSFLQFKKPSVFFLLVFFFLQCSNENEIRKTITSTGPINTISVFCEEEFFESELERFLLDSTFFGRAFPGIYFPKEISFNVRGFGNNSFQSLKKSRNIIKISKSDSLYFSIEKDKYAYPQTLVQIGGKYRQDILKLLEENKQKVFSAFKKSEIDFLLLSLEKSKQEEDSLLTKIGLKLLIPNEFKKIESKNNFVRYKKTVKNTIYSQSPSSGKSKSYQSIDFIELLVYKIPYNQDKIEKKQIIQIIDSIRKSNLFGKSKEDYPRLDPVLSPYLTNIEKVDSTAQFESYLLDSYWSMAVSQFGGPMLSKIILDKEQDAIYIADAFLFAPLNPDDYNKNNNKKRDYIRNLEAIFSTFKIKIYD